MVSVQIELEKTEMGLVFVALLSASLSRRIDRHKKHLAGNANSLVVSDSFVNMPLTHWLFFLFTPLYTDYEDIIHDAEAMRIFGFILEELELIFDGSFEMDSRTDCSLPVSSIVRRPLTGLVSVECLIRMYGRILVNSFAIPDSDADNGTDRLYSLQQIARGVYLG